MSFYFQVSVLIYVGFFCFISYITDARRGGAGTSTLLDPLSATFGGVTECTDIAWC
jgi:hypothetical protein